MPQLKRDNDNQVPVKKKDIFLAFLKLGFTSFGGPVAHIGYFREEFVTRRKWLPETLYGEFVALCQFLPGPTSSQIGFLIGLTRAGPLGALLAWVAFTTPSAIAMVLFAYGLVTFDGPVGETLIHGLKLVAIVVIAQALWGMSQTLTPDRTRVSIAVLSATLVLFSEHSLFQLIAIAIGALIGLFFCRSTMPNDHNVFELRISRFTGFAALTIFGILLVGLPLLSENIPILSAAAKFFQSGSLVFGGGHVVLPLLEQEFVAPTLIDKTVFLAGYGAAQAIPGPLFTFASYLGVLAPNGHGGVLGALIATVGIFLPGFLILIGVLPFWKRIRTNGTMRSAVLGANAAVVGILGAALYQPIWTSTVARPSDFILVVFGYVLLVKWQLPSWAIVLILPIAAFLTDWAGR